MCGEIWRYPGVPVVHGFNGSLALRKRWVCELVPCGCPIPEEGALADWCSHCDVDMRVILTSGQTESYMQYIYVVLLYEIYTQESPLYASSDVRKTGNDQIWQLSSKGGYFQ
jgi:hypothetical protein